ncbi:hypothetical protein [Kiritimatiella glycovorans]|nr:hypothetical protein [Kiritimatiella glycovorans]
MRRIAGFLLLSLVFAAAAEDMRFTTALGYSAVDTPSYSLQIRHDRSVPSTSVEFSPDGWDAEWILKEFSLVDAGIRYSFNFDRDPPDAYPIATGPVFNEFHLVNIVLRAEDGSAWPGLAELGFYGHADRLYVKVRFVTYASDGTGYVVHNDDGIASDNFVYEARE